MISERDDVREYDQLTRQCPSLVCLSTLFLQIWVKEAYRLWRLRLRFLVSILFMFDLRRSPLCISRHLPRLF
jgi:hypothetical protein